jgi:predicted dehydrogenase
MVQVARKHGRVVQVGTQQRSGPHYQRAGDLIRSRYIGEVRSVRMYAYRNILPGFGSPPDGEPPPELDWNLFLGPAPFVRYNPLRAIYHFRWFWDYSGGQMTNLGAHALDILHWYLGPLGPLSVMSVGYRYSLPGVETPDTQDAIFDYHHCTAVWSHREASQGPRPPYSMEFCGTKGSLFLSRRGFQVTPDRKVTPVNAVPRFTDAPPVGGPMPVQEADPPQYWTEPLKDESGSATEQFRRHVRNFLDCVKSRRQPVSDLESAHRVATACHLANLSLRLRRSIAWDPVNEEVKGDPEAAKLLVRPYRHPWDAELKALGVG